MSKKLKKAFSATLIAALFFTVFNVQNAVGADVTAKDLIGQWEARLKINKLELFGINENQRDELYQEEKVSQTLYFSMKDGKLMLSFGGISMPVTLSGGKLSGTYSGEYMFNYNIESTLDGTVSKSAKGIEFTIRTNQEMWSDNRKNGSVISCTYTSAGAETPAVSEAEVIPDAQEPAEEVIYIQSVTIEPKLFFLKVGATRQLKVKVNPPEANAGVILFKAYDGIAYVSESGLVKGLKAGYTDIMAKGRSDQYDKDFVKSRVFVIGDDYKEAAGLVLDTFWVKTKEFIRGESFQVQTPTATCGVRG